MNVSVICRKLLPALYSGDWLDFTDNIKLKIRFSKLECSQILRVCYKCSTKVKCHLKKNLRKKKSTSELGGKVSSLLLCALPGEPCDAKWALVYHMTVYP